MSDQGSSLYLQSLADGLPTRESHEYARYKLEALRAYLSMANTALHNKPWRARTYIDLQSGPGKINIGEEVFLGSPLISLDIPHPPNHVFFNELDEALCEALRVRVGASPLNDRCTIYNRDANEVVEIICQMISTADRQAARTPGTWSTFNIAFLDREGLELKWSTVERLAQMQRMDLIITFPTGGLLRTIGRGYYEAVTDFFGTGEWQDVFEQSGSMPKRALIDFYRSNLERFGYYIEIDPDNLGGHELRFKNARNAEVYSLVFASKDPLGDRLWKKAGRTIQPPKLPGF